MHATEWANYGIDYDRGMQNCMGSYAFYKKILTMFLEDNCFRRASSAYESGDYKTLFSCMHELKGISGNAALTQLYTATVPLVERLRREPAASAELDRMFADVGEKYRHACEGIARIIAEP